MAASLPEGEIHRPIFPKSLFQTGIELNMKPIKSAAKSAALKTTQNSVKTAIGTPKAADAKVTTIDVKLDVGFGNTVYLRGQGPGLSWERGVPLMCVDSATWRWSGEVKGPVTFKALINDTIWSAGNDVTVTPGQRIEVCPLFA
jgi:hypothetical protein